jgi:hypothetical protein
MNYKELYEAAVQHELGVVIEEPAPQPVVEVKPEAPTPKPVGNYLQEFGHLRQMVKAREVHDPMSSAGRWDDLEMDLKKPHISGVRRSPMRRNLQVTMPEGITFPAKHITPEVNKALGLKPAGGYAKWSLTSIKTDKWEHNPSDARAWNARVHREIVMSREADRMADVKFSRKVRTSTEVFTFLIRKMRFTDGPRRAHYEKQFKALWSVRHILRKVAGVGIPQEPKPAVPKVVIRVEPQPRPPKPACFDKMLAELGENAKELVKYQAHDIWSDEDNAKRKELTARQRFIRSVIGRWM